MANNKANNNRQSNRLMEADESLDKFQEIRNKNDNKSGSSKPNKNNSRGNRGKGKSSKPYQGKSSNNGARSKTNDTEWYRRFPELVDSAAKISFGRPLGNTMDLHTALPDTQENNISKTYTIPGVTSINFYPTIGRSLDKRSAINRSALRLFTYMRSHLKTTGTYDAQDMMIMMIALDSLYAYHAWMKRIYGIAQLWTPVNHYYPEILLRANGVDPNVFTKGDVLMELRSYINTFAYSLGQYTIPYDVSLFTRHEWMCTGLYVDSQDSSRAQTYMFVPCGFWQYDNTAQVGSQLTFKTMPHAQYLTGTTDWTLDNIKAYGDMLLDGILGDEDAGDISGDLLNAFGSRAIKKIDPVLEGYTILPTYDEAVLSQIENCDFCGFMCGNAARSLAGAKPAVITQDPSVNNGAILFDPFFMLDCGELSSTGSYLSHNHMAIGQRNKLANFHHDNPTPDQIIEATRLSIRTSTVTTNEGSTSQAAQHLDTFGSEVCMCARIFRFQGTSSNIVVTPIVSGMMDHRAVGTSNYNINFLVAALGRVSQFDWFPITYTYMTGDGTSGYPLQLLEANGDLDYVGSLSVDDLKSLNDVVMLSLFDIPNIPFDI